MPRQRLRAQVPPAHNTQARVLCAHTGPSSHTHKRSSHITRTRYGRDRAASTSDFMYASPKQWYLRTGGNSPLHMLHTPHRTTTRDVVSVPLRKPRRRARTPDGGGFGRGGWSTREVLPSRQSAVATVSETKELKRPYGVCQGGIVTSALGAGSLASGSPFSDTFISDFRPGTQPHVSIVFAILPMNPTAIREILGSKILDLEKCGAAHVRRARCVSQSRTCPCRVPFARTRYRKAVREGPRRRSVEQRRTRRHPAPAAAARRRRQRSSWRRGTCAAPRGLAELAAARIVTRRRRVAAVTQSAAPPAW